MTFEVNGSDALDRQLVTEMELAAIFNATEENFYLYVPPSALLPFRSRTLLLTLSCLPLSCMPLLLASLVCLSLAVNWTSTLRASHSIDGFPSLRYLGDMVEIKREVVEEEKDAYVPHTASQSIAEHRRASQSIAQHRTASHSIAQHRTSSRASRCNYRAPQSIALHHRASHSIAEHRAQHR
jgi:hypothetical protein